MNLKRKLYVLTALLSISGVYSSAQHTAKNEQTADWGKAETDVMTALADQKMDIADLAGKVSAKKPATAQDAMFKVNLLVRTCMVNEAITAMKELKALYPNLPRNVVENLIYEAYERVLSRQLAKAVVEIFADNFEEAYLQGNLIKDMVDSGQTVEQVDQWLAQLPPGQHHLWLKERLYFNMDHGRGMSIVKEISESIRKNPDDMSAVVDFLDGLYSGWFSSKEKYDLSWMTSAVKPRLATDAYSIAIRIVLLKEWALAAPYFEKVIETPLTTDEIQNLPPRQRLNAYEHVREEYAADAREGLAECLAHLGRKEESQKYLGEAMAIRKKDDLYRNYYTAGEIQREIADTTAEKKF